MSAPVFVSIDEEQARVIEQVGKELLRAQDVRATTLLAVFLAWRLASGQADTFSRRVPERFEHGPLRVIEGGAA